ncbi:tail fiber domain-containing protein [Bacillus cereus group sp. Bce021]
MREKVEGITDQPTTPGVLGQNTNQTNSAGVGVHGKSRATGVVGESETWHGVVGFSQSQSGGFGVYGEAIGPGVAGVSKTWHGVYGETPSNTGGAGVWGEHKGGGRGVVGASRAGVGVHGWSERGNGVIAESESYIPLLVRRKSGGYPSVEVRHTGLGALFLGYSDNREVFTVQNNGTFYFAGAGTIDGNLQVGRNLTVIGDIYGRGQKVISDRNAKENFSDVNTLEVLDNLASMPIQYWNYKEDSSSVRHIGPTAQDFHTAFGLNGDDDIHISTIDLQGVALAAIQGLNEKLKAENAELHMNLAKLEARISALESKN